MYKLHFTSVLRAVTVWSRQRLQGLPRARGAATWCSNRQSHVTCRRLEADAETLRGSAATIMKQPSSAELIQMLQAFEGGSDLANAASPQDLLVALV